MNGIRQLALLGIVNLVVYAAIKWRANGRNDLGPYGRLAYLAKKFALWFGVICLLLAGVGFALLNAR